MLTSVTTGTFASALTDAGGDERRTDASLKVATR
jgi:hypothetical protein